MKNISLTKCCVIKLSNIITILNDNLPIWHRFPVNCPSQTHLKKSGATDVGMHFPQLNFPQGFSLHASE